MVWFVTAGLAAVALRLFYPIALERRARVRLPLGPGGIIRGAEPITLAHKDAPAVLLLHGGGDTPQVLEGMAKYLYDQGYTVRVPLLPAHGRQLSALRKASADEWLRDARHEFDDIAATNKTVFLVGLSIGGALSVQLAADNGRIKAMVLVVPYLEMPSFALWLARWSRLMGLFAPYVSSMAGRSIRDRAAAARALGHGLITPNLLRAFHETVVQADRALPNVKTPTLVIHSRSDNRIPVQSAQRAFERLGAAEKQLEFVGGAAHVLTVDFGHERVFRLTRDWLENHRT
jgi:carboxylesterase